jgi:hypothetical protein
MSRKHNDESKYLITLDPNIQRPKVLQNQKNDRNGSKTAPIDSYFVDFFNLEF